MAIGKSDSVVIVTGYCRYSGEMDANGMACGNGVAKDKQGKKYTGIFCDNFFVVGKYSIVI